MTANQSKDSDINTDQENIATGVETPTVRIRETTRLDQFVLILEISFIFLLIFSLIALFDTVISQFQLYQPISNDFLGVDDIGSLDGGNFEAIVRITLIFNLLLFTFSLIFGLWMRHTRDGWTWSDMGYTLSTPGYSFMDLIRRGLFLGLISIIIFFVFQFIGMLLTGGNVIDAMAYTTDGRLYTARELNAEYYFGIVEMGFIWPLSAGFFFFAYVHNSMNARFHTGVANVLSTFFYVFYLQFFFLIGGQEKITALVTIFTNPTQFPMFWMMTISLWIILYINFSAFAETGSIVLPFLLNFVFNVGITLIRAGNALAFQQVNMMMLLPLVVTVFVVLIWSFVKREDLSTIKTGAKALTDFSKINFRDFILYVVVFILLSFALPGIINELLFLNSIGEIQLMDWIIPVLYAINFIILISLATVVLTYEPTEVFDVLLLTNDGVPVASHIELFETDEVLISGFFTALSAVDEELSTEEGGLKSIKRGDREILIEDGVFSKLIAFADQDQSTIRNTMQEWHRNFEIKYGKEIEKMPSGGDTTPANELVDRVGKLEITFNIPAQTKWITSVSLALAPTMIALIGLL